MARTRTLETDVEPFYSGVYSHTIDGKGRIIIPAGLVEKIGQRNRFNFCSGEFDVRLNEYDNKYQIAYNPNGTTNTSKAEDRKALIESGFGLSSLDRRIFLTLDKRHNLYTARIYAALDFERIVSEYRALPDEDLQKTMFFEYIKEHVLDKQSRFLLPEPIIKLLKLKKKENIKISGINDFIKLSAPTK